MKKRITKTSYGDYKVEWGKTIKSQPNPVGIGYIMPGFMVYKMSHYNTLKEAKEAKYE